MNVRLLDCDREVHFHLCFPFRNNLKRKLADNRRGALWGGMDGSDNIFDMEEKYKNEYIYE